MGCEQTEQIWLRAAMSSTVNNFKPNPSHSHVTTDGQSACHGVEPPPGLMATF
jgi:hypothetical protein